MSLLDLASLVLAPTATKEGKVYSAIPDTGDGDMTFSRGTAATRVNSAGLIEKERANLLLQSNTFDTTWLLQTSALTSGQSGYDGSNNAWLLERQTTGSAAVYQVISVSGVHTFSVYAKAGTADGIRVRIDQTTDANLYVDLTNGSIINQLDNISANVTSVGKGWYRVEIAYLASGMINAQIRVVDNGGAPTLGTIYIQDAQLEQGLVATDYIETTTTAVYEGITDDVPRVDYSSGGCPALLLEPQRTNLVKYSEQLDNAAWINSGTIVLNQAISPDGTQNACLFYAATGTGKRIYQTSTISIGNTYTLSIFAKASGCNFIYLPDVNNQVNNVWFDLSNGTFSTPIEGTAKIENYGNGWYKCSVTTTSTTNTGWSYFAISSTSGSNLFTANGTDGVLLWGAQFEEGSYPTSYIPTYGTSVTRSADSCSKTGISSLIGQTEGTMFLDFVLDSVDGGNDFRFDITEGSSFDNEIFIGMTNGDLRALIRESASNVYDSGNISATVGTRYKMALAYANNDVAFYINGTQEDTSSSATIPNTDEITIGNRTDSKAMVVKESLNQAILFPTRLTNDELAALTK